MCSEFLETEGEIGKGLAGAIEALWADGIGASEHQMLGWAHVKQKLVEISGMPGMPPGGIGDELEKKYKKLWRQVRKRIGSGVSPALKKGGVCSKSGVPSFVPKFVSETSSTAPGFASSVPKKPTTGNRDAEEGRVAPMSRRPLAAVPAHATIPPLSLDSGHSRPQSGAATVTSSQPMRSFAAPGGEVASQRKAVSVENVNVSSRVGLSTADDKTTSSEMSGKTAGAPLKQRRGTIMEHRSAVIPQLGLSKTTSTDGVTASIGARSGRVTGPKIPVPTPAKGRGSKQ
jgi:hypothetical protein